MLTARAVSRSFSSSDPSHQTTWSGLQRRAHSSTQAEEVRVGGKGFADDGLTGSAHGALLLGGDDKRIGTNEEPYDNRQMTEAGAPLSFRLLGLYPKKAGSALVGVAAAATLRAPSASPSWGGSRPPSASTSPRPGSRSASTPRSSTSSRGG